MASASSTSKSIIGSRAPRWEGPDKVRGKAAYLDDVRDEAFEGLLYGTTIRSTVQRGRIESVELRGDLPWDDFVIVSAADIPGKNVVTLLVDDQPFLAEEVVNHVEEPILLLAHEDRYLLEEARRHVHVEISPLPAVSDIEESLACDPVITAAGPSPNVFKEFLIDKGDVDAAFARLAGQEGVSVLEGTYRTGAQEQLYIEPQGMVAAFDADAGVTVWGSTQCPYYVKKALIPLFELPGDKVRIIQTITGGGFGGKEDYPSLLAGHAALLAMKSGRPVKMLYDRAEDLAATTKRHPSRTIVKTAVDADGKLLALDVDFILDGGAYATLSAVVLSRGTIHAAGPYLCPDTRVRARAVATNTMPHGAFRGFGAPQSIFALERHLDRVARVVGLEPDELRRRNLLAPGLSTSTEQVIEEDIDLPALMDFALDKADWKARKAAFAAHNADPTGVVKKGVGLSCFYHGAGFTGSGEVRISGEVAVEAAADGRVTVLAASSEMGQGSNTVFAIFAADALAIPYEWVDIAQPDTARVPDSGPTVASRTTMVVGGLVGAACRDLLRKLRDSDLLGESYTAEQFRTACAAYCGGRGGELRGFAKYEPPPGIVWDESTYKGSAYAAYGWAVYVAAVSVATVTYEVSVDDFVAVQDIGTVVQPMLAEGQIEGGVAQAIGWSLYEDVVYDKGRMANARITNYIMPTSVDVPPIRTFFVEVPYKYGPGGAKGTGELPHDGPAPAVLNAIEDAVGISFDRIPVLPEDMMAALRERAEGERA